MAEVIKPLSLEVAALAAGQQQQQLALETLQLKLTEQEEATKKALLEASESKAAALRAAQEQHRQASVAALEQHERALAAVQTQLQEREAAMEMALLENERLQDAVAAAKQRAGEAELRAGEMERRAEAAEAAAAEARAARAALASARPSSSCAPGAEPSAVVTAAAAQALDVEGMWHDAVGMEGLQGIRRAWKSSRAWTIWGTCRTVPGTRPRREAARGAMWTENSNYITGTTGDDGSDYDGGDYDGGDLGSFPTKKAKFCAAAGAAALCPVSCDLCKESCDDGSTLPSCVAGVTATDEFPGEAKKNKFLLRK